MLAESQESKVKEFIPPVYPTPKLPSYQILYKKYLKTRDFYVVDPVSRSYSINRWVEKYGHSHCDETIYDDLYKIRWTEMSHSASIWIDYLDINNNAIDGEWYLNELKANEVMKVEYGNIENAWEEQEFRAPML